MDGPKSFEARRIYDTNAPQGTIYEFVNTSISSLWFILHKIVILILQVLTIEETPFVYARKVELEAECTLNEIPCPHYNTSDSTGKESTTL